MKPEGPATTWITPIYTPIQSAFHGYIAPTFQPRPGYGFGVSYYATVWALVEHSLKDFQVGLPGTWILPENSHFKLPLCPKNTEYRECADSQLKANPHKLKDLPHDCIDAADNFFRDVFQTIEGGAGYWSSSTQFPTNAPKYRINGIPDCYSTSIGSPGWPFGKTARLAADAMGLAQLSNRLVIPPDGIPFAPGSEAKQLGIAWMALPLTDYDGYFLLQSKTSGDQDKADEEADPPRETHPLYLQRGSSFGVVNGIDKGASPNGYQLWMLVPGGKNGYFYLATLADNTPFDFGGDNTLWKLVPSVEDYYFLESGKDKNKCLGVDGKFVKIVPRSNDAAKLWRLVPRAVERNQAGKEEVEVPTGDSSWTLFFNAENFKGPVAFFPPKTWSRISKDNPEAAGRGLDARMALLAPPGMEFNTVPGKKVQYNGDTYLRIPKLSFPTEKHGTQRVTPLMRDMMLYSREAIYAPVMSWFAGGPAASGAFGDKGAIANRIAKDNAGNIDKSLDKSFDSPGVFGNKKLTGFSNLVELIDLSDPSGRSCSWGLCWKKQEPEPSGFAEWQFPEYFVNGEARPTFKVPYQTGLSAAGFDAPDKSAIGKKYDSPATVMWHGDMVGAHGVITSMVPSSKTGDDAWLRPGPILDTWSHPNPLAMPPVYSESADLKDGSRVLVYWYKFINQPALQNLALTDDQKNQLQSRVELLHKKWNDIKGNFMKKPSAGALVSLDPNLIVKPPKGYEAGYVPIVVLQDAKPSGA